MDSQVFQYDDFNTIDSIAVTSSDSDPSAPSTKDDAHDPDDDLICGEALLDLARSHPPADKDSSYYLQPSANAVQHFNRLMEQCSVSCLVVRKN